MDMIILYHLKRIYISCYYVKWFQSRKVRSARVPLINELYKVSITWWWVNVLNRN